jgi:hypothetical protein
MMNSLTAKSRKGDAKHRKGFSQRFSALKLCEPLRLKRRINYITAKRH